VTEIIIPYRPREWFKPLHATTKRWVCDVAHRRAGKSVAQCNHLIRAAISNPRPFPPPRYAYIGPSFAQTKDLIWGYFQQYAGVIPGTRFSESELSCTLPTGAKISLYGGAQAYERIRGLYLDGAVLDEFPLLHPDCFDVVVRPALADYGGFGILSGTPQGRDHFFEAYQRARSNPDTWDVFTIPVTETTALHPDEIEEMRRQMTPNQFAREMLCSFDAPVEGSYYGDLIVDLQARGHITKVPYDRQAGVVTAWDLGMHDHTSVWFAQRIGKEYHIIDALSDSGKGLDHYVKACQLRGYNYVGHIFPHDVKARELGTGRSRYEVLEQLGLEVTICRDHSIDDGIAAVRSFLPECWFNEEPTEPGVISLKSYQAAPAVNLGTMHARPLHNWSSHYADAFRYLAMGIDQVLGWSGRLPLKSFGRGRWRLRGLARRV
jgi:phage terminase large subunit